MSKLHQNLEIAKYITGKDGIERNNPSLASCRERGYQCTAVPSICPKEGFIGYASYKLAYEMQSGHRGLLFLPRTKYTDHLDG